VREALQLRPDRIALFGYAHVPWMKRHQRLLPEDRLPDAAERIRQMRAASAEIAEAGYVPIGLDHFARRGDSMAARHDEGTLHRNFQGYTTDSAATLIGFGTSAIGSLPQGYVQNAPSTVAWREAIASGRLATVRGVALSREDRLRRTVIERLMCDLSVDVDAEARFHGLDAGHFTAELERIDGLAGDGIVVRDGTRVTVPEEARLLVRNVCAVFDTYLSPGETRHARAL
jgi:oxygen-independent coproporphyrinogen-3 oxidase